MHAVHIVELVNVDALRLIVRDHLIPVAAIGLIGSLKGLKDGISFRPKVIIAKWYSIDGVMGALYNLIPLGRVLRV